MYQEAVCKGSLVLGTACKKCQKCLDEMVTRFQENADKPLSKDTNHILSLILDERNKQITVEGHKPEDDDKYQNGEMAVAGGYYALASGAPTNKNPGLIPPYWPWSHNAWKPGEKKDNLIKAAALIVAELESMRRKGEL